ncbi:MAG TPA: DUF4369 domain-containing protein [Bacteroidales bacterium]|nr:DUF4369 domain-containing protein [Bacteroidales bacterium]HRW95635.1 DUF4369 domain-containing protein [Bacteroidales bacterium]
MNSKRLIIISILAFLLGSCANQRTYEIKGTLPHEKYDGEYVFLLPLDGVMPRIIDSVRIKDKSFVFTGKADSAQVKIIRLRPQLRLDIQELLVVQEPGEKIWVRLDSLSSSGGTRQNESLQAWKEAKMKADQTMYILRKMHEANENDSTGTVIMQQWDKIQKEFSEYNRRFIEKNEGTAVGRFVKQMTGE